MKKISRQDIDYWIITLRKNYFKTLKFNGNTSFKITEELRVRLPDYFILLENQKVSCIFSTIYRPPIVFGNKENCYFTFQLLDNVNDGTDNLMEKAIKTLHKMDRKIVFYNSGNIEKKQMFAIWQEFKSFAVDYVVYNQLIFINYDEVILLCTFHCPFQDYSQWVTVIPTILESITKEDIKDD